MSDFPPLDVLLWTVATIGTVWAVVPPLLCHIGLTRLRFDADDTPGAADPTGDDLEAERLFRQLWELGFRPAGVVTEHSWFLPHEWHKAFRLRYLTTPSGDCFAGLYRLDDAEAVRVVLHSPVSNGGLVTTVTPGAGLQALNGTFARIELAGARPAELLARHWEHVDHFVRESGSAVERETLAGLARRSEEYDRLEQCNLPRHGVLQFLGVCFGVPSFLGLVAWQAFGTSADLVRWAPASLYFGTVVYAVVVKAIVPYLFRLQLACDNPRADPDDSTDAAAANGHAQNVDA
jgi:hypothetical protein